MLQCELDIFVTTQTSRLIDLGVLVIKGTLCVISGKLPGKLSLRLIELFHSPHKALLVIGQSSGARS